MFVGFAVAAALLASCSASPLASAGFLDVTLPPHSADPTGKTDSTKALQAAFDAAVSQYLVAYLPLGTYMVSAPLTLLETNEWDPQKTGTPNTTDTVNNTWPCRFKPNVVVGARATWDSAGAPVRPIIRLADHAKGFDDASKPTPVLDFTQRPAARQGEHVAVIDGTNFNQLLRGVDVHIGQGTPGATGVMMPGAQGCSVQDVTVVVGSGYSGITGGSGAGGGHLGVTVLGGRVGLDYSVSLNAPGTSGFELRGQTEAAIVYKGLEAATFVGGTIAPAHGGVPALRSTDENTLFGQATFVDTVIEYAPSRPLAAPDCVAFLTSHSLVLRNVHVRHCAGFTPDVPADALGWSVAHDFALGVDIKTSRQCQPATMPLYLDGTRQPTSRLVHVEKEADGPPASLVKGHLWDEKTWPTWDMPPERMVDARGHGAVGDGSVDDSLHLQAAIDAAGPSRFVFVPKGFYRLSRTLNLTCAGLVGAARQLSVLMPLSDGLASMPPGTHPLLRIPRGDSPVLLTMFSMVTWEHLDDVYALDWRSSSPASAYRQCYFFRTTECFYGFPHPTPVPLPPTAPSIPCKPQAMLRHPLALLADGAAGLFFNFENEDFLYEAPSYRHLLVRDTQGPLRFYNMNFEHASSESNAELLNASHVAIYSFKSEGEWRDLALHGGLHNPAAALWLRNCSDVFISSFGGNARPMATGASYPPGYAQRPPSLYRFEGSCGVVAANFVDQFQFAPDDDWNFLYEEAVSGEVTLTAHCERPVWYASAAC